ncbi:MAG: hypothetical protein LH606_19645 [Cytophagaceae bacterium]|nr:hypothetical protein [Cytophagaceae bacterium]
MNKRTNNKYVTPGAVVFNILFILAYPIIAVFTFAYTVLVWVFSLPSRVVVWIARRLRRENNESMSE